jgi:hypothetical protein
VTAAALDSLGDLLDAAAQGIRSGGAAALLLGLASLDAAELAAALRRGDPVGPRLEIIALAEDASRLRRDGPRLGIELGEGLSCLIETTMGAI